MPACPRTRSVDGEKVRSMHDQENGSSARPDNFAQIAGLRPAHAGPPVAAGPEVLEIEFDRPMASAIHLFGELPQITGSPCWDDDGRVLRIPVALTSGTRYRLSFNEGVSGGFRGAGGEVLAPRQWIFDVA
jgi:hypothetical protein